MGNSNITNSNLTPDEQSFAFFIVDLDNFCSSKTIEFDNETKFTFNNDNFKLICSLSFRRMKVLDKIIIGSSLDVIEIHIAPHLRRQGYGTQIFQFLRANTFTDFIFVKCINSDELTALLDKKADVLKASPFLEKHSGWLIEKDLLN